MMTLKKAIKKRSKLTANLKIKPVTLTISREKAKKITVAALKKQRMTMNFCDFQI